MKDTWMIKRLASLAPLFQKYQSPISVATRMAQFVIESNGGRSPLYLKSNNGFGIKASFPWKGKVVEHPSLEANGQMIVSQFRAYKSLEEGIEDHANFFTSTNYRKNVAYKSAIDAKDSFEEARSLAGIYASDPLYGEKLIQIIKAYDLTSYNLPANEDHGESDQLNESVIIDRRLEALGGQSDDRSLDAITTIVWHYTGVKRDLNRHITNHESFWQKQRAWDRGGYHFYIDSQARIYQNYDLERITWGVANCNHFCVHLSVEANAKEDYSPQQIKARDWLTRKLMKDLNLPASAVKGHWEVNNNSLCPGYTRSEMNQFRRQLALPIEEDRQQIKAIFELAGRRYQIIQLTE
ncbi:glucosaminidase domain-containing protein [Facklamia sp. 7083-14-GEN3]|uniref:glucosaminidase domain-containing protein n=1 Tax=Facklamia sp. 7083-14-GEN3 TaxID=2973478 RepID=UPI00215CD5D6|nr:glucosaminidase domain-containing protein [Facklamia sp. 7083-14-GEN3]MCR8968920.1 N-acetylmuramoyl-L-alanine amidase [Facklamia sp. 7083-14-GEN3]